MGKVLAFIKKKKIEIEYLVISILLFKIIHRLINYDSINYKISTIDLYSNDLNLIIGLFFGVELFLILGLFIKKIFFLNFSAAYFFLVLVFDLSFYIYNEFFGCGCMLFHKTYNYSFEILKNLTFLAL